MEAFAEIKKLEGEFVVALDEFATDATGKIKSIRVLKAWDELGPKLVELEDLLCVGYRIEATHIGISEDPLFWGQKFSETIIVDLEKKLQEFLDFYKKTGIELPPNFEETIKEIWFRNLDNIQKAIEENGFDEMLIMPGGISLPVLADRMKVGNGYDKYESFKNGGDFAGAESANVDKPHLVLAHKTQNLKDRRELAHTLNIKGQDVKMDQALTLEDYLVFQKKYFEETGKHLDEDGWTWLATKSGARLVYSSWDPGNSKLSMSAAVLDYRYKVLGVRPAHTFY